MVLRIYKETPARIPTSKIKYLFEKIMVGENRRSDRGVVNLVFTDNKNIRRLNKAFRRLDKATDVLSFNLDAPEDEDKDSTFGEIYISAATARKQALEYKISLTDEFLRLVCHGLLHLYGYDHIKKTDGKVMKTREEHYLKFLRR